METLYADQKLQIFEDILAINNKNILNELQYFIIKSVSETKKTEIDEPITFEEWNKQFTDNLDLDEFIPEYGTTLREFRKGIYEAEISEDEISFEELLENIKQW